MPAQATRGASAAAASEGAQSNSVGDDAADEMTEEQIEAERRAALSSMPAFGGGLRSPAEAAQQKSVPGMGSGQQNTSGGAMPKSSFPFGLPAASAAAGQSAASPQAGAPSAWPSLLRTQPASADAISPASQQISPTSVFGRLAAGGASASTSPLSQQVLSSILCS